MPVIEIPPGVVSTPTNAKNSSNWRAANLIRWSDGAMEPVAPWERFGYTVKPATNVRAVHQWTDNSGRAWTAYLTEDDVFVEFNGDLVSINPVAPLTAYGSTDGGYGDGSYSTTNYGVPIPGVVPRSTYAPAFTLDNWGENLEIMTSPDGRLLEWVPPVGPASPDPAVEVLNAPSGRTFVVTPERHIIIFAYAGNPSQFAWCDKEDNTNWDFADVASEAGNFPVQPASPILTCKKLGSIGTLFWTLRNGYITEYIGKPYIYDAREISETGIPLSSALVARTGDQAVWLAESGVWKFNGVSVAPVQCDIWAWIKDSIDLDATRNSGCAIHVAAHAEVWIFFSTGATVGRNDRLAIFNYRDGWWSQGYFGRNCGFADDELANPVMADGTAIYRHESGEVYDGVSDGPWLETFALNVAGGENISTFRQLMPEIKAGDASRLSFQLAARNARTPDVDTYTSKRKIQASGYVDFITSGRDFRLRISADDTMSTFFRVGDLTVDIKPRGRRAGNKR